MRQVKITNPESPHCGKVGLGRRTSDSLLVFFDDAKSREDFHIFSSNEIEVLKIRSIYKSTLLAYNWLPKEFSVMELVRSSRLIYEDENKMDATITKRLRELRADGKVNYEYNTTTKKYKKL